MPKLDKDEDEEEDWSRPHPPLTSSPGALFFYQCKRCKVTPPSQFEVALPLRCNHPVCLRCLRADLTSSDGRKQMIVELHDSFCHCSPISCADVFQCDVTSAASSSLTCSLLLCPECGAASDYLIRFDATSRHLLLDWQPWAAKLVTRYLSNCDVRHRHAFSSVPSSSYVCLNQLVNPEKLHFTGNVPTLNLLTAQMDFWLDEWLTTARRHFQSLDSVCSERAATLKAIRYLRSVADSLNDPRTDRGVEWNQPPPPLLPSLPSTTESQEKSAGEVTVCRICMESVLKLSPNYSMLDCCSHCYCSDCINRVKKFGCEGDGADCSLLRCPTCRRLVKKFVEYGRFYVEGSKEKAALFRRALCVQDLLESVLADEGGEVQVEQEEEEEPVVQVEEEVVEEVVEIVAEEEVPEGEDSNEIEEEESKGKEPSGSKGRRELKHRLTASLWRLLTGCITKK